MAIRRRPGRNLDELVEAFLTLRDGQEGLRFLTDLCTDGELRTMAKRWEVARLLDAGLTYEAIEARTGMSSATISRIKRSLTRGAEGYRLVLGRQRRKGKEK